VQRVLRSTMSVFGLRLWGGSTAAEPKLATCGVCGERAECACSTCVAASLHLQLVAVRQMEESVAQLRGVVREHLLRSQAGNVGDGEHNATAGHSAARDALDSIQRSAGERLKALNRVQLDLRAAAVGVVTCLRAVEAARRRMLSDVSLSESVLGALEGAATLEERVRHP